MDAAQKARRCNYDQPTRMKAYAQIEELLAQDQPAIFFLVDASTQPVRSTLRASIQPVATNAYHGASRHPDQSVGPAPELNWLRKMIVERAMYARRLCAFGRCVRSDYYIDKFRLRDPNVPVELRACSFRCSPN